MNKYERLLNEWCSYLLQMQNDDGGFDCEACETKHGRADNAVFPLIYEYSRTKDNRFLSAAEKLMQFRKLLTHSDGAVQNDFGTEWKGITTFSAINLYKTLFHFENILPKEFKAEIEKRFKDSAKWVHENIRPGFRANINYYAAASIVNAMYGTYYGDSNYISLASELLDYCMKHFTENGLITGEGQPHNFRTEKGCAPVDIGYNVEETLPCLVSTANLLDDQIALNALANHAEKLLDFMLPDGDWDNTFGVRNNKWTYYGSRTSDGCIGAFAELGKLNPIFYEAAERTFEALRRCTHNGKLYGGLNYVENNQPPCIHHTFCHAAALADALCFGIEEPTERKTLPCDREEFSYKYYPEIDTYKIHAGKTLATITGYDYSTYTYPRGAAHSSGGTLSLLYHADKGAVISGTVYDYKPTEQFNMQMPVGDIIHSTLIPRAKYEKDGIKYATCLDGNAEISVQKEEHCITANVKSKFVCIETKSAENESLFAEFAYRFYGDSTEISVTSNADAVFVLPIIKNSAEIKTENAYTKRDIFFLTGGFSADEYSFRTDRTLSIKIICQ